MERQPDLAEIEEVKSIDKAIQQKSRLRLPTLFVMEIGGFEPLTYTLRTYRSPN